MHLLFFFHVRSAGSGKDAVYAVLRANSVSTGQIEAMTKTW